MFRLLILIPFIVKMSCSIDRQNPCRFSDKTS